MMIKRMIFGKHSLLVKRKTFQWYSIIITIWQITGRCDLPLYLQRIFKTWNNFNIVPKVHISSPKSDQAYRSHADFVSLDFVLPFLKMAKELNQDFDIMIEAKQKNLAMQRLVDEIAAIRGVKRISGSSVEW